MSILGSAAYAGRHKKLDVDHESDQAFQRRFEGKEIGGRVHSFSYEDQVCILHLESMLVSTDTAASCGLQVYEAGASIAFAKNYYVR